MRRLRLTITLCALALLGAASMVRADDITETQLATSTCTAASSCNTASITPPANDLILAFVWNTLSSGTASDPSLSGNGLTWVEDTHTDMNGDGQYRLSVFRAMGGSPSAGAVTISFGGVTQTWARWYIVDLANVDTSGTNGSGAIRQSVVHAESSASGCGAAGLASPHAPQNRMIDMVARNSTTTSGWAGSQGLVGLGSVTTNATVPVAAWGAYTLWDPYDFTWAGGAGTSCARIELEINNTSQAYTRLYLSDQAAGFTPTNLRGSWDLTTSVITKGLIRSAMSAGDAVTNRTVINTAVPQTAVSYVGVSDALAAQTISGHVNLRIATEELSSSNHYVLVLHLYVTEGDSDTVRGTLLSTHVPSETTTTSSPCYNAFQSVNGIGNQLECIVALSSVAVQRGDRLVAEIGAKDLSTTGRFTLWYGTTCTGFGACTDVFRNVNGTGGSTNTKSAPVIHFDSTLCFEGDGCDVSASSTFRSRTTWLQGTRAGSRVIQR